MKIEKLKLLILKKYKFEDIWKAESLDDCITVLENNGYSEIQAYQTIISLLLTN